MNHPDSTPPSPNPAAEDRITSGSSNASMAQLAEYQSWLQLLARLEIDSRFQGKFSASDAVQQTLLEAWRGWHTFRGDSERERMAWLRQILAHQLAHLARHFDGTQKRDVGRERSLEQSLSQSSLRLEQMLAADVTSPSGEAMARERSLRLAEVLARLPADYREVIVLRNLQDLSHAEVAQRLNRSEAATRQLWLRALARLRSEADELRSL